MLLDRAHAQIRAGWYREPLTCSCSARGWRRSRPCVGGSAWWFLPPRRADPVIVGRNAYATRSRSSRTPSTLSDQKVTRRARPHLHIRYYTDWRCAPVRQPGRQPPSRNELPGFDSTSDLRGVARADAPVPRARRCALAIKKPLQPRRGDGGWTTSRSRASSSVLPRRRRPSTRGRSRRTRRRPDRAGKTRAATKSGPRDPGGRGGGRRQALSVAPPGLRHRRHASPARAARPRSWSPRRRVTRTWCALLGARRNPALERSGRGGRHRPAPGRAQAPGGGGGTRSCRSRPRAPDDRAGMGTRDGPGHQAAPHHRPALRSGARTFRR